MSAQDATPTKLKFLNQSMITELFLPFQEGPSASQDKIKGLKIITDMKLRCVSERKHEIIVQTIIG